MAGLEPKTAASMKSLRHHAKLDLKHTSTGIELPLCLGHRGYVVIYRLSQVEKQH